MLLSDHLRTLDKDGRELLATQVGSSSGYLYLLAGGHRKASPALARKIEEATGGRVTRHELRPDVFDPPTAQEKAAA